MLTFPFSSLPCSPISRPLPFHPRKLKSKSLEEPWGTINGGFSSAICDMPVVTKLKFFLTPSLYWSSSQLLRSRKVNDLYSLSAPQSPKLLPRRTGYQPRTQRGSEDLSQTFLFQVLRDSQILLMHSSELYLAWENERLETSQLHDTEKGTLLGMGKRRGHWAPGPRWSQAMGVVPGAGGPSGHGTVGVVAGTAGWRVSLDLLAKGAVVE